jgi:hypothetical protein
MMGRTPESRGGTSLGRTLSRVVCFEIFYFSVHNVCATYWYTVDTLHPYIRIFALCSYVLC